MARVHVKEIARLLNRPLPGKISQGGNLNVPIMSGSTTCSLVKRDNARYGSYKGRIRIDKFNLH